MKNKFVKNHNLPVQMEFSIEETEESLTIILRSHNAQDAKKLIEEKVNNETISKITDDLIYRKETRYSMSKLQFISIQRDESENEVLFYSYYQVK